MKLAYIRDNDGKLTDITIAEHVYSTDDDLSGVDVSDQDLTDYNFYGCNFQGANLSGCDLRDVDFEESNLSGANLSGANLSGADLRNIITDEDTILPYDILLINKYSFGERLAWDTVITPYEIRIGCQCHPIEDWENATDDWIKPMANGATSFWCMYSYKLLEIAKNLRINPNPQPKVTTFKGEV